MRAARYSSTLSVFHTERRTIKLMFLYNGYRLLRFLISFFCLLCNSSYPPRYLYQRFSQFFFSHPAISVVLPTINNANCFTQLRCLLLNRPTIPEYEMASRIAKAIETNRNEEADDPLVRARLNKQSKFDNNLIIHYIYEKRLQSNNMTQELIHRRQTT